MSGRAQANPDQQRATRRPDRESVTVSRDRAQEADADRVAAGERLSGSSGAARVSVQTGLALGPGVALPAPERSYFERRLGTDLSQVRVHPDTPAADGMGARAFASGRDIGIAPGLFRPGTGPFRELLGHEIGHVLQQATHEPAVQLKEVLGTPVTAPAGTKRPFKTASATFDGRDFVLTGDGKEVLRAAGQSGRPITVRPADAKTCGGSPDDSYLNNPRYVGIADNGPIPEGEYTFRLSEMTTFTGAEQLKMLLASEGDYVDPSGLSLHGDWGAGRGPLRPIRIVPARTGGNTATRSGFYLHGGSMPGSSGCIDIGNSAISDVISTLRGYPNPVHVIVKYTQPPPDVGTLERAAGRFMYPPAKNPSIWDRLGNIWGGGDQ
jgi:hypothetical protein